jgi:hypothetical protein
MTNLGTFEMYDEDTDVPSSKIIIEVFRVKNGFLPNWELEVRDKADMAEIMALRDGLNLAINQFEKLIDMIFIEDGEEE